MSDAWSHAPGTYLDELRWSPEVPAGPERVSDVVALMARTGWMPGRIRWKWLEEPRDIVCLGVEFLRPTYS